jgi:anthranilate/para-aminobenzoate synthase component II
MTERFKLVNKSRINNNRVRLIKTGTSTSQLDPLFGAIYENESEVGLCLSPSTIISCVGAKVESEEIVLDGASWAVEIDGVVVELPSTFAITPSSSTISSLSTLAPTQLIIVLGDKHNPTSDSFS